MVTTELRSGRESAGGSIEYESDKEVCGESIVVISWKGHFGGTQTQTLPLSLYTSVPLYCYCTYLQRVMLSKEGGNTETVET